MYPEDSTVANLAALISFLLNIGCVGLVASYLAYYGRRRRREINDVTLIDEDIIWVILRQIIQVS